MNNKKYEVVVTEWQLPSGVTVYNYCNPEEEKAALEEAAEKSKKIKLILKIVLSVLAVILAIYSQ